MHTLNLNLNTFSLQLKEMLRNYSSLLFTSPFFQGAISNWAGDLKAISWTDVGYSFVISTSIKQEEKSMEKAWNISWSKAYNIICETWWSSVMAWACTASNDTG